MIKSEERPTRENKLNKAMWFMRISIIMLVLLIIKTIMDFEIAASIWSWILLGLFIVFIALGLGYGISGLRTSVETQELAGETNG